MTTDRSYGFVPVLRTGTEDRFLLVRHAAGHWGFPKGHPEGNEEPLETARRELLEECSIVDIEVVPEHVFSETYTFMERGDSVEKTNVFFLGFLKDGAVKPQEGEIAECRLVTADASLGMDLFDDTRRILSEVHVLLSSIPQLSE